MTVAQAQPSVVVFQFGPSTRPYDVDTIVRRLVKSTQTQPVGGDQDCRGAVVVTFTTTYEVWVSSAPTPGRTQIRRAVEERSA
jgi:hypothetical protein